MFLLAEDKYCIFSCYSTSIVKIYFVFVFVEKAFPFSTWPHKHPCFRVSFGKTCLNSTTSLGIHSGRSSCLLSCFDRSSGSKPPACANCLLGSFSHQHLQGKLSNVHLTVALRWSKYLPDISHGA
jgi:hypothetical protein